MRIIFTVLLLTIGLNASILLNKIENLVGEQNYRTHKNLIELIFKEERQFFLSNERLNYLLIFRILRQNGLLNLKLPNAQEIEVEFQTNYNPVKSLKILNDTLKTLGYYYYFTKTMTKKDNGLLVWKISLQTEYIIDPFVLITEIIKNGGIIFEISRNNNKWIYKIDTKFTNIADSITIEKGEMRRLQKPLKPYMLKVDDVSTLEITVSPQDRWFTHIVFYDANLNILDVSKNDTATRRVLLNIPQNTRYIKINDLYTLDNIKRGLSVTIK